MSAADIIAIITAATGLVTAVLAGIAQIRHQADPQAHDGQGHTPGG